MNNMKTNMKLILAGATGMMLATSIPAISQESLTEGEAATNVRQFGERAVDAAAEATQTTSEAFQEGAERLKEAADTTGEHLKEVANDVETRVDTAVDALNEPETPDIIPPASTDPDKQAVVMELSPLLASDMIGTSFYSPSTENPGEGELIGEVSDIVFSEDGVVAGYLVDVGGFLGIGSRTVVMGLDTVEIFVNGDEHAYITTLTREEMEVLPEFVR